MYKFVTVRFKNSNRSYDYRCELEEISRGDLVRVNTSRGEQIVEVIKIFWCEAKDLEFPLERYKYILGKVETPVQPKTMEGKKTYDPQIFRDMASEYIKNIEEIAADSQATKAEKEMEAFAYMRNVVVLTLVELKEVKRCLLKCRYQGGELSERIPFLMSALEASISVEEVVFQHFGTNRMMKKYMGFILECYLPVYKSLCDNASKYYSKVLPIARVRNNLEKFSELSKKFCFNEDFMTQLHNAFCLFGDSEEEDFKDWTKEKQEQLLEDIREGNAAIEHFVMYAEEIKKLNAKYYRILETNNNRKSNNVNLANTHNYTKTPKVNINPPPQEDSQEDSVETIITDPKYFWHPMNVFYDEDETPEEDE